MSELKKIKTENIPDWISNYLAPNKERANLAFQFTINGVTYPFVRKYNFAALPDPPDPRRRRYSMLSALYLTRPGDLLFFFQADPQWRSDDVYSRRGLRGIYRIKSVPFRGIDDVEDESTRYKILGHCPECGTFHATLARKCPICEKEYPETEIPSRSEPYRYLVLSLRLEIEPLVVFERTVSDERCYADMTDTGMIWIGRHDNQMGPGKGSSVRQLLPEEAVKLTRMMISEPGQRISFPKRLQYPFQKEEVLNSDGTKVSDLELRFATTRIKRVAHEHMLNFDLARSIDQKGSSITKALGPDFIVDEIEYISSEFPWGYTAGTSDFVVSLAKDKKRYKIFLFEFKSDRIGDDAFIQVSLYTRWVTQTMSQFARNLSPELEIVPVVIGRRLIEETARPKPFTFSASYNSGVSVKAKVRSPKFIKYVPENEFSIGGKIYARKINYLDESQGVPQINWVPEAGIVTSKVESDWVKNNSWRRAKEST